MIFIIIVTLPVHYFCAVGFTTLSVSTVIRRRIVVCVKIGKNLEKMLLVNPGIIPEVVWRGRRKQK